MTLQTLDEESSYTRAQPPAVQFKGERPEPQPSEETDPDLVSTLSEGASVFHNGERY